MNNELSGQAGQVVQAHSIHGGVHFPQPVTAVSLSIRPPFGRLGVPVRGRDQLIAELDFLIRPGARRIAVLHGLGGCGKTTVALAFARHAADEDITVWWVSATTATELQAGMRQVAAQLGALNNDTDQANTPDLVWSLLEHYPSRWLLVVDNADDPMAFGGRSALSDGTGWLRDSGSELGAVVVTTRYGDQSAWGHWCTLLRVESLDTVDATRVLMDSAGPDAGPMIDAAQLAARLGGLPLALKLAGAYLAETSKMPWNVAVKSFKTYMGALDSGQFANILGALAENEARQNLSRTWELSLGLLDRRGFREGRSLLYMLCCFADSDIPAGTLLAPDVLIKHRQFVGLGDPVRLWRTLTELANLGLVDMIRDGRSDLRLRIHPLVRDASRYRADEEGRFAGYLAVCATLADAAILAEELESPEEPDRWPFWQSLTPHALELARAAVDHEVLAHKVLSSIVRTATACVRSLSALGMYQRSVSELTTILRLSRARLGEVNDLTLDARHCLASVRHFQGKYESSLLEYQEVLEIRNSTIGGDHPSTLATRHQMAWALRDLGRLTEAEAELRATLAIRRKVSGERHIRTLTTWQRWALVLQDQGDLIAAKSEYVQIAAIEAETLGALHRHTLSARHLLAVVMERLGELDAAEAECQFVLDARLKLLGPRHPATLVSASQAALMSHRRGCLEAAEAEFQAVIDVQTEVLGATHPHTMVTRDRLADVVSEQGRR